MEKFLCVKFFNYVIMGGYFYRGPNILSAAMFLVILQFSFCLLKVHLIPERQQETIADQQAQPPQDSQPQADIVEVVVAAGQQIPGLQFLSGKPFGHFIIHDAFHSSSSKIENVR